MVIDILLLISLLMVEQEPFDNEIWTRLLCEWIAACDQPFDTVESPEFKKMIEYASRYNHILKIPAASTVKNRIMGMGNSVVTEIRNIIQVLCNSTL